jgi:hypothetical protein
MAVKKHPNATQRIDCNWVHYLLKAREGKGPVLRGLRIPFGIFAGLSGFIVFYAGWLVASLMGFQNDYQRTPAVRAACVAIAWVLGSVYWGLQQLRHLLHDLDGCFETRQYLAFADKWRNRFFSNVGMFICAAILFVLGSAAVYVGMFDSFPAPESPKLLQTGMPIEDSFTQNARCVGKILNREDDACVL